MNMEYNVLEHEMVPEHHLLSEKEEKEVLDKFDIGKDQLPKIRMNDPCIKILEEILGEDIQEGRLVKVVRISTIAGISETYRVVIAGR